MYKSGIKITNRSNRRYRAAFATERSDVLCKAALKHQIDYREFVICVNYILLCFLWYFSKLSEFSESLCKLGIS
jgi:hypothetical protein